MNSEHYSPGPETAADNASAPWWETWLRPKGNIDPPVLAFLLFLACMPLLMAFSRVLALPGASQATLLYFEPLVGLGVFLNQTLSLEWVPPADRSAILYLLLLPLGALVISVARLTFGLRILGFRSILIAIGFQEVGVVPSLLLLAVVVGVILVIRPPMRRIRLPLFARISIILCTTAIIMVLALLLAPIVRSEVLWSVAFFPVIILAMLAEGIAKTLARDNAITAIWRASWTLIVALIFAAISMLPAVRYVALNFPELMLTQLICIALISEYLDFRLLQHWPEKLSRLTAGVQSWRDEQPFVAVVRNRWNRGVIGRLGQEAPPRYRKRSVQSIVDALRDEGFRVKVIEGDMSMLKELRALMAPNPRTGAPSGIVLNLASGVQGTARFAQVPAMLELAGIAYSGPDPAVQAVLHDRYLLLNVLKDAGINTPAFGLAAQFCELEFPLIVRSRVESEVRVQKVSDRESLDTLNREIMAATGQSALLEERVSGREFRVALIGNDVIECLPLLERGTRRSSRKMCPAELEESLADQLRELAYETYKAVGCRDYARIDIRVPDKGAARVMGVHCDGVLARRGSFVTSAEAAGYSYQQLMHRLIDVASARYGFISNSAAVNPYALAEYSHWLPAKSVNAQ